MMNLPFKLQPAYKDYLWGGSRLNDDFGKKIDCYPLAETWECSTHPDGKSMIYLSDDKLVYLSDLLEQHPEYLGYHTLELTNGRPELPILVKLIDANKDLSIQVHPDDDYAKIHENSYGKTEMWYVLDAEDDSRLVYGFNQKVETTQIRNSIDDGSIGKYLNYVHIKKNNVFFIEPGTVHAICSGAMVAEIQENSNITYRLYDYDRIDSNGNKRMLHIDKALDVACLDSSVNPRQPMRVLSYRRGFASELLGSCKYFQVKRLLINTDSYFVDYKTGSNSFHSLLCVEGFGAIMGKDFSLEFKKGDCIFVPADSVELQIIGNNQLLDISC